MTDTEKDKTIYELKQLTYNYFNTLKDVLEKSNLVYASKHPDCMKGIPFNGIMPKLDNEMLEDLCLDIVNCPSSVQYALYDKRYVQEKIDEYNDYYSPKNRILRHLAEVERLKEKYKVSDEDLKK